MTALLAKAGHAGSAAHLTWPDAFALIAAMACCTAIIVVLIVITARQGAKR